MSLDRPCETVAGIDEYRATELPRLDALHPALWDKALAGDVTASNGLLRISDQRRRLLGSAVSPARQAPRRPGAQTCRERRWCCWLTNGDCTVLDYSAVRCSAGHNDAAESFDLGR